MADELVFTLSIKDNASPQIDAFTSKIKGLGQNAQKEFGAFRESFNKSFGDLGKPIQSFNDFKTSALELAGAFAAIGVKKAGDFVVDSVKNFAAYEQTLAGVQRTVGMTKEQTAQLGESLRTLALTDLKGQVIADDLASIAEAAGQMGITAEEDILAFTKAVAQVSVATGQDMEKTALSFGRIADLFKESLGADAYQQIGNIGSAFDALADSSSASVQGILNYTNRLAGTATALGLTVDQTAAIGATLESMGVPAERGSTAISKVFLQLKKDSGSFAEALNIDADKLKTALETKPVEGVNMVIAAMAKMNAERPTEFLTTMEDLLGKGSGVTEVALKLSEGSQQLATNMSTAAKAMGEGTRAGESFGTAASTQAASWQTIKTAADDLSKSLGQQLKPITDSTSQGLALLATDIANTFRAENVNAFFDFMVEAPNKYIIEPFNAMSTTVKELMASTFDGIVEQINGIVEKIKGAAATVSEIKKALTGGGSVESSGFEKGSQQALREVQQASLDLLRTNSDLKTQFFELRDAYNAAYANGGQPTQELIDATSRLKDEMMGAAGATPELKAALDALNVSVLGADDALEGHSLTPALRRYIEAALASGTATAGLTSEMQATMQGVLAADAAYSQLEKDLNQNQRAILEVEKSMQALKQASISASDFGKKQIAEGLKGLQVKRSELMLQKKTIQEQMDLKREEIDLGKDAVKVFEDQQKAQEDAAKARIKAEEELQKNTERTADLRRKQQEDEMKAANELYREQQKQAADSIKWINSLDEATKKRVLGEKDAVKILQEQGVELTDLQAQEVRRMQAAYKTEAAYAEQGKALEKQLSVADNIRSLGSALGNIGNVFGSEGLSQIGVGLSGLPDALKNIKDSFSGLKDGLSGMTSGISGFLGGISSITGVFSALSSAWQIGKSIFEGIKNLFKDTKSAGTEASLAFQDFLKENVEGGAEMAAATKANFDAMSKANFDYQTFLQQTGSTMSQVMGGLSQNWQQGSTAMDIFTQAVAESGVELSKAPQVALQAMAGFDQMGLSVDQAGQKMLEIAEAAGMSDAQLQALQGALSGATSGAQTFASAATASASTTQATVNSTQTLSGSLATVSKSYASAAEAASAFAQAQSQAAINRNMQGLIATPTYHMGGIIPKYHTGGLIDWTAVQRAHSGTLLKRDEVPIIAQTGEAVLNRGAVSMLGVGGVNALNRGAMSGTVINVNITGNNITKDTDLRALAREVSAEISKSYRARA